MTKETVVKIDHPWIVELTLPLGEFASKESAQSALDHCVKTARVYQK